MSIPPPRPRANYSQELRDSINELLAKLNDLAVQVATLPSRQEIAVEFDKRVSSVAYQSDRKALEDRIAKLEQSGQQNWAKAAVIVSIMSGLITILVATHIL
jgi:hypothetical protein